MPFASGPVSFQRFSITGPMPEECDDVLINALNEHAFGRMPPRPDDVQLGWIGPGHLFESKITPERIAFGSYVHVAMRVDTLKVPPNVLRAYVRMEEETALEATGREFLSRGEKRKARAAAVDRAEAEARDGGFRRMASVPVLIDLAHRVAYLGATGTGVADQFMLLFSETFGAAIESMTPEFLAVRIAEQAKGTRALESLAPFHLVEPPDGAGPGADFTGDMGYLGRELITWLWYQTEVERGPLKLRAGDEVTVMLDKMLRLKCDFGLTGTDVITADGPTSLPEARAALRAGKQPNKAGLVIGSPVGEFALTLDGERLTVSALNVPEDDAESDPRAQIEQRFELIADAANLLDALFEIFVHTRTGREWDAELDAMSRWAAGERKKGTHRVVSA